MFSEHNIVSKIQDSENYFIVNLLSKNADILEPDLGTRYNEGKLHPEEEKLFREKGYITDPAAEKSLFQKRYIEFLEARANSEVQIFFVPSYECNFACTYCYQEQYAAPKQTLNREIIDAFFAYIDVQFAGRKKYITIFGGEPLLPSKKIRENLEYFIDETVKRELGVAVVTNGYHLADYLELLSKARIREIQVTLDGTEEIHNRRRPLKNGSSTFMQIAEGIDEALKRQMSVNLRVVLDKDNIDDLPHVARFASERGWTKNSNFKTQLGRNYELHVCQKDRDKIFSRIELYDKLYTLVQDHPVITEFHRPAYSVSRFLFDRGELPEPLFDSCPGCTTEWAFDYTGSIYSCTATVGKAGEELGTFYPESRLDADLAAEWEDRDVISIPECRECGVRLACGGGCASVAKNSSGKLKAPDCRPVRELLELGTSLYFEKECVPQL